MIVSGNFLKSPFAQIFGLLFTFSITQSDALEIMPYTEGAVHEAYIAPATENGAILRSISQRPPQPIKEQAPQQCTSEAIWIPGYWSWNEEIKDFIWISGVWRSPPPNQVWISGEWRQFGGDWVWIRGFWSPVPLSEIQYIGDHPPSPIEEAITQAPGDDYYWMPGYWEYNFTDKQFRWLTGKWVRFDPEWIYTPAGYLWRPEGYIFVQAYWDQPLELRGCAYSPVRIEPAVRESISYTPNLVLQPESVIHYCFTYYPNYELFFRHHFHFHPDYWERWCCTPPWWGWETCWCFSWSDTWGLWWWWTHPGYPNPHWINLELSGELPPPTEELIQWMHSVTPPTIITPWGAVTPGILIDAIGGNAPVLPANAEKIEKIYNRIRPENYALPPLKPTGKKNRISLPRPEIGESQFPKELHVVPPPKPIRIPESYVEPPTYVTPKPQAAYPVLPSPPPGYLPAVPKPFYDQLQEEEYPAGYYRSRSPRQRQTTAQSRQASKPLKYTPPQNNANR